MYATKKKTGNIYNAFLVEIFENDVYNNFQMKL